MMKNNYYAVIMAGGVGSRFWPISTRKFPKQFHDILGTGKSLIQLTFDRFQGLIPNKNILIATNKDYKELVQQHLPNIKANQILLEPAMRNTAPCILYSALKIYNENPDGILVIAPSDHLIEDEATFLKNIESSFQYCEKNDELLTLGIKPSNPNTGYGYIKFDKTKKEFKNVLRFTEKPDLETATQFVNSGDYLWNAGIFVWSAKNIIEAFNEYLPEMYSLFSKGNNIYNSENEHKFIEENYVKSENVSIDFGIMEKANNVCVLPVDFGWDDLGTWASLYRKLPKDDQNNATLDATIIYRDSSGNMVKTQSGKHVVIQGLNDYIVIEKENVLLICPKEQEQEIKEITSEVKEKFGEDFI